MGREIDGLLSGANFDNYFSRPELFRLIFFAYDALQEFDSPLPGALTQVPFFAAAEQANCGANKKSSKRERVVGGFQVWIWGRLV